MKVELRTRVRVKVNGADGVRREGAARSKTKKKSE